MLRLFESIGKYFVEDIFENLQAVRVIAVQGFEKNGSPENDGQGMRGEWNRMEQVRVE